VRLCRIILILNQIRRHITTSSYDHCSCVRNLPRATSAGELATRNYEFVARAIHHARTRTLFTHRNVLIVCLLLHLYFHRSSVFIRRQFTVACSLCISTACGDLTDKAYNLLFLFSCSKFHCIS